MPRDVGAVIVAGGRGVRAGGDTPKQYRPIVGVPMVLRALRPFTAHPDVAEVVLVLPADDAAHPPSFLAALAGSGLTLVAGGAERRDSVRAGLRALRSGCGVVVVHDAARPFVGRDVIDAVVAQARRGVGAVAAIPVSDTLKKASADEPRRIAYTVPRDGLWRAQTPQAFPRTMLERAHAAVADVSATDDAALVEALGEPVVLVPDSPRNFKVTTADDFLLAELLASRPGLSAERAR